MPSGEVMALHVKLFETSRSLEGVICLCIRSYIGYTTWHRAKRRKTEQHDRHKHGIRRSKKVLKLCKKQLKTFKTAIPRNLNGATILEFPQMGKLPKKLPHSGSTKLFAEM